jgi:hypothetical protein
MHVHWTVVTNVIPKNQGELCLIIDFFNLRRVWDTKGVIRFRILKKNRQHNGKEKGQKDKQRSTKHTYKTQDRVTRTPLITEGELKCSERVNSSCSTSGIRRVNVVAKSGDKSEGFF